MHAKTQTVRGRLMRKIRQSTVEPVIATLVCYGGMRKVNTIGIVQANKCMLMAAVAYNLKKLLKWKTRKPEVCLTSMEMEAKTTICCLYNLLGILPDQLRWAAIFQKVIPVEVNV